MRLKLSRYNLTCPLDDDPEWLVVYNTFSKACVLVRRLLYAELQRIIESGLVSAEDDAWSTIDTWRRQGLIVSSSTDELANIRYAANIMRYQDLRSSMFLTLAPTMECNMACTYCFESPDKCAQGGMLEKTMHSIARLVFSRIRSGGNLGVTWYGGEPLLVPSSIVLMTRLLRTIQKKNRLSYTADVVTNGYLLTPDMVRLLRGAEVQQVQITLDGPESVHNERRPMRSGGPSFEAVIAGIKNASQHIRVNVRVNVDRRNQGSLSELLDTLQEEGLLGHSRIAVYLGYTRYFEGTDCAKSLRLRDYAKQTMLSVSEYGRLNVEFERMKAARTGSVPRPARPPLAMPVCGAVRRNSFLIRGDGEVFKCWGDCSDISASCGNINNGIEMFSDNMTKWMALDLFDDEECVECPVLPVCLGGCAFSILHKYPKRTRCSPIRFNYREMVNDLVRYRIAEEKARQSNELPSFYGHKQL